MHRHAAQTIHSHHQHHNHHHYMDQLQIHQHDHQHRCPADSRLHLQPHQSQQQDHYQQQYQHDDQQQLAVGLQQHYQLQQQAPVELGGCGSAHYGYTSVGYAGHQPPAPVVDQYEQQQAQLPPDSAEVDADAEYQLSSSRLEQKPPIIDEWDLSEHHLQQHHANSFAYINNYPFHPQQQQHEQILQPQQPQPSQHHLLTSSQPPLQPARQQDPTEPGLCLVEEPSPEPCQGAAPVLPPAASKVQAVQHNGQPAQQFKHPQVRAKSHQTTRTLAAREQAPQGEPSLSNGVSLDAPIKPRTRKQNNAPISGSADQLESKYPKRIKIGEHEEIEYLRNCIIVRNFSLQLEITLTNKELGDMGSKTLNRKLSKASTQLTNLVKGRRRTLKNRGYAANCRTKREAAKKDLEKENKLLRERVNKLVIEVSQVNEKLQLALSASCTCLRQQFQQMVF